MIKSDGASSATPYEPLWGWQRPECRGRHAVEHAQSQVDTLLVRYDEVADSPNAF
jgi:hypothetical protein